MRLLQQQVRLCSSGTLRPQQQSLEYEDTLKILDIPPSACVTQSQRIQHDRDNGQLFKVFIEFAHSALLREINWFNFQASDLYVRLAAPSQLQPKPDADALSFGKLFTDHMMKVFWHKSLGGWQKPEITPMENLVIHPAAKVLHYAVEVSINHHVDILKLNHTINCAFYNYNFKCEEKFIWFFLFRKTKLRLRKNVGNKLKNIELIAIRTLRLPQSFFPKF